MSDQPSVRPEDAVQIAQRALAKVNDLERELDDLRDDHDDVVEDLTALKLRIQELDEDRDYESLTLDEKIGKVREHAFQKAVDGHGRTTLDYDDVMWEVFNGEPGTKHCYKLMRLAAGDTEEEQSDIDDGAVGFAHRDPDDGNQHLAVDADRAKRSVAFFPENKTSGEGVRIE